jgi:CBS domain containing-hemolysin-like protein
MSAFFPTEAEENLVEAIAVWIVRNAERESIFLGPNPQWNVNGHSLLDFLAEKTGIPKETIGHWVGEEADKVDKKGES